MRLDMVQGDKETALILDFDGQRMIALDSKKQRGDITSQAKLQEVLGKTSTGEIKASVTPTAETKTIAGFACKVHNVSVEVPFSMGGPEMQMALVMAGPACLSKDAPGYADYQRLYTTVAEKGWILGDPRGAQGPGAAMAKGMANFQKTMAAAGDRPRAEHARRAEGRRPDGRHDGPHVQDRHRPRRHQDRDRRRRRGAVRRARRLQGEAELTATTLHDSARMRAGFLEALQQPGQGGQRIVIAAELRPPRAELDTHAGMGAWIDTYHAVRALTRRDTFVCLTDSAVGAQEEDNLRHLVANLGQRRRSIAHRARS